MLTLAVALKREEEAGGISVLYLTKKAVDVTIVGTGPFRSDIGPAMGIFSQ